MKFPAYPSKGKLVADTVRDILNYIRATRITKVIGGKLKVTPNGTTIDVSTSVNRPSEKLHFKVTGAVVDGSNYKCRIRGGWYLHRNVSSGTTAVQRVLPQISVDGTPTNLPPEDTAEIILTAGQYVYLQVNTNPLDELDATPTIIAGASGAASTQAQPPDDTDPDGTDGVYYYPIAYLDGEVVKQIQQGGPMHHDPLLWRCDNVGGGVPVFQKRDTTENKYNFRTLILESPLSSAFEWQEPDPEDEELVLKSNGVSGTYADPFGGQIDFTAGVAMSITDAGVDVADLNLTINRIVYSTADLSGNDAIIIVGTPSEEVVLYWRNGLFIGTTDPADAPVGLIERTVTHLEAYVP